MLQWSCNIGLLIKLLTKGPTVYQWNSKRHSERNRSPYPNSRKWTSPCRPPGIITSTLHDIADMLRVSATRRDRRSGASCRCGLGQGWRVGGGLEFEAGNQICGGRWFKVDLFIPCLEVTSRIAIRGVFFSKARSWWMSSNFLDFFGFMDSWNRLFVERILVW